jgi:hypothetical protein
MHGLVKVMLVKELLEWDIHDTPQRPTSFSFKSMGDIISQHINQG